MRLENLDSLSNSSSHKRASSNLNSLSLTKASHKLLRKFPVNLLSPVSASSACRRSQHSISKLVCKVLTSSNKDSFVSFSFFLTTHLSVWAAIKAAPRTPHTTAFPFPCLICFPLPSLLFVQPQLPEIANVPQPSSVLSGSDRLYSLLTNLAVGSSQDQAYPGLP